VDVSGLLRSSPSWFWQPRRVQVTHSEVPPPSNPANFVAVASADHLHPIGSWLLSWALIGLPFLGLLFWSDDWLRSQRSALSGKGWNFLAATISGSANGVFLIPAVVGLGLWFKRRSQRRAARLLGAMLLAGLVSGVAGTGLRSIIGRTRPEVSVEQGWFGPRKDGRWIIGRHAYASFPSGHASIAAGLGFMAFVWGARAGGLGLAFALAVAWSRFHLGAHRASDVWAGLLVGGLMVALLWPSCWDWVHRGKLPSWWPWSGWLVEEIPHNHPVDSRQV